MATQSYYWQYEQWIRQLHSLIADDRCDEKEADDVRDQMDAIFIHLNKQELYRLENLSGDLYMLNDEEVYVPTDMAQQTYTSTLFEAWNAQDWDGVLDLLRMDVNLSSEHRAYLRARAYQELHHFEVALLFMNHALNLNRGSSTYSYKAMELLEDAGHSDQALKQAEDWLSRVDAPIGAKIKSSAILFSQTRNLPVTDALEYYRKITVVLLDALEDQEALSRIPREALALAYIVMGFSYRELGNYAEAIESLREALKFNPHDVTLQREIFTIQQRKDAQPNVTGKNGIRVPKVTLDPSKRPTSFDSQFFSSNLFSQAEYAFAV